MKYIIEHLDEEIGDWSRLEYGHIHKIVGDRYVITNVSAEDKKLLPQEFKTDERRCWHLGLNPERVCLLDLSGEKCLTPDEAGKFDAVVFGGILGDHPPRDRTGCLRAHGFTKRLLGNRQMSTDTAVLVVKKILEDGHKLGRVMIGQLYGKKQNTLLFPAEDIQFDDDVEVRTGDKDTTLLPYRYVHDAVTDEPLVTPGLAKLLAEDEDW